MQNLSHQCLPLHTNTCAIAAENSYLTTTVAHISSSISMLFSIINTIFSTISFLAVHSAINTPRLSKPEYTHPKGISNLSALKIPNLSKPEFTHPKARSNLFDLQDSTLFLTTNAAAPPLNREERGQPGGACWHLQLHYTLQQLLQ